MPLLTPRSVYRNWEVDGVPTPGTEHMPKKSEIIQLLEQMMQGTAGIGDYQGAWRAEETYVPKDYVERGGSIWYALRENTDVVPTEGDDWTLLLPGVSVADAAVTTAKLADASVTSAKLALSIQKVLIKAAGGLSALTGGVTILATDDGETFNFTGSSDSAFGISVAAGSFTAGFEVRLCNSSAKLMTIIPGTDVTLNGVTTSFIVNPGQMISIMSGGGNALIAITTKPSKRYCYTQLDMIREHNGVSILVPAGDYKLPGAAASSTSGFLPTAILSATGATPATPDLRKFKVVQAFWVPVVTFSANSGVQLRAAGASGVPQLIIKTHSRNVSTNPEAPIFDVTEDVKAVFADPVYIQFITMLADGNGVSPVIYTSTIYITFEVTE